MTNPFALLEESNSQQKTQKKQKKKKEKKKNVKKPVVKKAQPQANKPSQGAPNRRKPKVLIPVNTPKKDGEKKPEVEGQAENKASPAEKRNFDGPSGLKNYKRDNNKGYFNRKQGNDRVNKGPAQKGGKRYNQRDRSINRTGKNRATYRKNGEGGKHSWNGRYVKKKPQEMNDEEWDKQIEIDQQNQKNEEKKAQRSQKKKKEKKVAVKTEEKKEEGETSKDLAKEGKKKNFKKDFKKGGKFKKDFKKGKKFDKKKQEEEVVVEEEESDDEDKTTFEEYEKTRKRPVRLNDGASRKARQGIKVLAKQEEFTRVLKRDDSDYMKVSKKNKGKKQEVKKTDSATPVKSKKKSKKKQLSTSDFFKGGKSKGFKGKKGNFKGKSQKKVPNLKDNKNFPSLS